MLTRMQRIEIYTRDLKQKQVDGTYRLTPKQRRRVSHKFNKQTGVK